MGVRLKPDWAAIFAADEAVEHDPLVLRRRPAPELTAPCRVCRQEVPAWHFQGRAGRSGTFICRRCANISAGFNFGRSTARGDKELLQTLSATLKHLDWEIHNGSGRWRNPLG